MNNALRSALAVVAVLSIACPTGAEQEQFRNRVSFSVERTREVENDWLTAVVGATHEDADPAAVADRVNEAVNWGLGIAKAEKGVTVRTGGYTTRPISDPKRAVLRRWRGSQTLVLEGANAKQMSGLIGKLQARLQLQDLRFSVSPERRRAVEAGLVDEVLQAFRERAARVQAKLGAGGYEIVSVGIDTAGGPGPMPVRSRVMMAEPSKVAPPALEGGTSTLRAGAHATIELEF
ncbi:MAG: SIMPL domain-containing protein [Myxococcota bacterium]|nr:SIMPL domain-containing protein [Myxococcota bacterium]